jgi:hypothetical protein
LKTRATCEAPGAGPCSQTRRPAAAR